MLTLWGSCQSYCDGITRRSFLRVGAFGAGVTLADVLRARANNDAPRGASGRAKSAIMIYLGGGPTHIDTYDPKPDAPVEFRGETKAISTNVPGIQVSALMPRQAKMFDKLAVIRSIVAVDEHSDSLVMTGYPERDNRTAGHPSFGAVVSKVRGNSGDVPPFVSLRGLSTGLEPGYLGVAHRAFTPEGPGVQNLRLPSNVTAGRLEDRKDLLATFDTVRREIDATGAMKGLDAFTARAFEMVASGAVRKALDLGKEDTKVRERYRGVEQFLTARRLVEAGVGVVTLSIGGWDMHANVFPALKRQLPQVDLGVSNLIQDLHDRGLGDDVVTVMWGEFGRTPKVNGTAGRDHWSPAMFALVAGGGLKMGQAIGSTTARGETPKDRRYTASQVLATLYRAMGIDPGLTFPNGNGRPMYVLDDREPVTELL